jgi:hypothetical protein
MWIVLSFKKSRAVIALSATDLPPVSSRNNGRSVAATPDFDA